MRLKLLLSATVLSASLAAHADSIAGRSGGTLAGVITYSPQAASFTITQTYTDVSISAYLSAANLVMPGQGTVYLTDQIGPGTTVANQISSIALSGVGFAPLTTTDLFSGLTLGPGTYYIVTDSNTGGRLGWDDFTGNTDLASTGNTTNTDLNGTDNGGYPPANTFTSQGTFEDFDVSTPATTVTPEPSGLVLMGTGLLGVAGLLKRRFV